MGTRDPRIDAYISRAAPFAQPVLSHLREVIHAACPEVEESIKWGHPSFAYHGILCGMAAFREHASFGFWKGKLVLGADGVNTEAMGQFGCLTRVADLPSKRVLAGYVKQAMQLNEEGITARKAPAKPKPEPTVPPDLKAALAKNRVAATTFKAFPPGQRREYVDWIIEAKQDATRGRRVAQAVEWLAEGKRRNWKYER